MRIAPFESYVVTPLDKGNPRAGNLIVATVPRVNGSGFRIVLRGWTLLDETPQHRRFWRITMDQEADTL